MIGKLLSVLLVFTGSLMAQDTWNNLRITNQSEVAGIFESIQSNYGPLKYKESYFRQAFQWSTVKANYVSKITNSSSTSDFYKNISELFSSLRDAHVSVSLPSDFTKSLDLEFAFSQRSTFVSYAGADALRKCKLKIGDKLVKFNGQSPRAWRDALAKYSTTGNAKTDLRYLTMSFTSFKEARGVPKSFYQGDVAHFVLDRAGQKFNCDLKWVVSGYPLESRTFNPLQAKAILKRNNMMSGDLFGSSYRLPTAWENVKRKLRAGNYIGGLFHQLVNTHAKEIQKDVNIKPAAKGIGQKTQLGSPVPFFKMPAGFKPLKYSPVMNEVVKSSGLLAGTFPRKGRVAGFLRIPSYVPQDLITSLFAVRYVISILEKNTDYLVIDQTNNPGGYVAFSDWIINALVPSIDINKHMQFLVRPNAGFLRNFGSILKSIEEIAKDQTIPPKLKSIVAKFQPLFKESYARTYAAFQSQEFLSRPVNLSAISFFIEAYYSLSAEAMLANPISPFAQILQQTGIDVTKRAVYTKPKYMMINELDFSGGDATPANLQDYGVVTLVGVNTSGAGGSVGAFQSNLRNPFEFRLTESLMYRPSRVGPQRFVENLGVQPDVNVDLTIRDYQNGFSNYFERVLAALRL